MSDYKGKRHANQVIASDLIHRLESGDWKVGDKFPSIDELTEEYEYSRCTVTKAVQELIKKGFLNVRKSVGTFVEKTQMGKTIGLVVGEEVLQPQKSPFAYLLTRKLTDMLKSLGYSVIRFIEEKSETTGEETIEGLRETLLEGKLDALVTTQCNLPQYISTLPLWLKHKIPHLCVASIANDVKHQISLDSAAFMQQACAFLRNCHLQNVAVIDSCFESKRTDAFLTSHGLGTRKDWLQGVTLSNEQNLEKAGYDCMMKIWCNEPRPNALVVTDDIVMKGVAMAVGQLSIKVPDQLRIIHLANCGSEIFYPFTTDKLEYSITDIASRARDLLIDLVQRPNLEPEEILIAPRLVIGS